MGERRFCNLSNRRDTVRYWDFEDRSVRSEGFLAQNARIGERSHGKQDGKHYTTRGKNREAQRRVSKFSDTRLNSKVHMEKIDGDD